MQTIIVMLAVLATVAAVNAQSSVPLGSSCLAFNQTVCVGAADGTLFDNIADCNSPFCHTTYVVCSGQNPITMRCPKKTVWNQSNRTCINREEGPGGCPALCGEYDPMACQGQPDGTRLTNPIDCQTGGMATSFLYCLTEVPIVTECPDDSVWVDVVNSCIDATGVPQLNAPEIPGLDDLPLLPVDVPAAPAPAPAVRRRAPRRTRPVLPVGQEYTMFSFYIQGKDLTEVTDYIIEQAVANATGASILAIERLAYIVRLGLVMRDFGLPLTPATVEGIQTSLPALFSTAYAGVRPREVRVNNIQGGLSTASFDTTSQSVTTVVDIVNREELQTAVDIMDSLPNFDVVLSEALASIANNTAARLGVTTELADYFNTEMIGLSDYSMIINVTLLHTLGSTGNQLLQAAVRSGDMTQALNNELDYNVVAVMSLSDSVEVPKTDIAEAPAPSMVIPVQATPVTPVNGAFAQGAAGVVMAGFGAMCLSAILF